jgi:hypothetical protein
MCGSIRKSTSVEQSVDYALAYAESVAHDYENAPGSLYGTPQGRRASATDFIENYVPAKFRKGAVEALKALPDDGLTTTTSYWGTVIY